jgi:hypothetical protein
MYVCVCVNILLNHSLNNGIKRDGDSLSSTSHSRAVGQPQTEANSMGLNNNIVYVHQCVCNIQKDQPTERKRYFPSTVWNCNNFSVGGGQCSTFSRTFGGVGAPKNHQMHIQRKRKKTYFFLKKEKKKGKIYSD